MFYRMFDSPGFEQLRMVSLFRAGFSDMSCKILSATTLNVTTVSITTLSITALSITALSIATVSITTLSIMSKNDIQLHVMQCRIFYGYAGGVPF
jgi:hypothetical protein